MKKRNLLRFGLFVLLLDFAQKVLDSHSSNAELRLRYSNLSFGEILAGLLPFKLAEVASQFCSFGTQKCMIKLMRVWFDEACREIFISAQLQFAVSADDVWVMKEEKLERLCATFFLAGNDQIRQSEIAPFSEILYVAFVFSVLYCVPNSNQINLLVMQLLTFSSSRRSFCARTPFRLSSSNLR